MLVRILSIAVLWLCCSIGHAEEKVVEVPLSSIVTTSPQKGMLHIRELLNQPKPDQITKSAQGYLSQIVQASKSGASNVFLVDAGNAPSAIASSFNVFVGPWAANTPAHENSPNPNRGLHWLVVYLGWGDPHTATWEIDEVRREGNLITLGYRKKSKPEDSDEDHRYFYWVPIAKLSPGSYEVKLEDADSHTTTLMRRVEVLR
jgi:hypothetical protein